MMRSTNTFSFLIFAALAAAAAGQQNGDVRLVSGLGVNTGRLEVFYSEEWINVCYDYLKPTSQNGVAQAVCRQLGFNDCVEVGNVTKLDIDPGSSTSWLTGGNCPSILNPSNAAEHILRCNPKEGMCASHGDDMAIKCGSEEPEHRISNPYDTMVSIYNDESAEAEPGAISTISTGFPQIYLNEKWNSICGLEQASADTFCRQLGYTNANSITEDSNSSLVLPEPALDQFDCSSSTSGCLQGCFNYPAPDLQVNCSDGYSFLTCTFDTTLSRGDRGFYGTENSCTGANADTAATIAGVVIGAVMLVGITIVLTSLLCFYWPGCFCNKMQKPAGGWQDIDKPTLT